MKRKSLSRVLSEVDPELTVIPGGSYRHGKKKRAVKLSEKPKPEVPQYEPQKITNDDWNDAGGVICPLCQKETVRLLTYGAMGLLKACPVCIEIRQRLVEHKHRLNQIRETAEATVARRPGPLI